MLTRAMADARLDRVFNRLDQRIPDWEREIVLDELDMGNPDICLLAQVYGTFEAGCDDLFPDPAENPANFGVCCSQRDHFDSLHTEESDAEYELLTRRAKKKIRRRLRNKPHEERPLQREWHIPAWVGRFAWAFPMFA